MVIEVLPVLDLLSSRGMPPRLFWDGLPPGAWLIFGIILVPIYTAVAAWYLGTPSTPKHATMAFGYLIGLTLALWVPFYIATVLIGLIFFGSA